MGQKVVDKLKRKYQIDFVFNAPGVCNSVYVVSYTSAKRIIAQIRENGHVLEFVDDDGNDIFLYTRGVVAITLEEL